MSYNNGIKEPQAKEKLDREWMKNVLDYELAIKNNKTKYPKQLYQAILNGYFHDASIDCLSFEKNRNKKQNIIYNIILLLNIDGKSGKLIHYDVTEFTSAIDLSAGYIDFGDYMYGEILYNNGFWSHDFLIFRESEINIKSKKIEWKPEK